MSFQRSSPQGSAGFRPSDWIIALLLVAIAAWVWSQSDQSLTDGPSSEIGSVNATGTPRRESTPPDEDAATQAEIHEVDGTAGTPVARSRSRERPSEEPSAEASSNRLRGRPQGTNETEATKPVTDSDRVPHRSPTKRESSDHKANARDLHTKEGSLKIANQTIRDLSGRVVYRGVIDLKPTIDRIERGDPNRHRNDGTIFQNRERRIPAKGTGYYKEYVHPTPGEVGPGPQRVIIGQEGEVWYTPDHYRTFIRVNSGESSGPSHERDTQDSDNRK